MGEQPIPEISSRVLNLPLKWTILIASFENANLAAGHEGKRGR